eukprot:1699759-Pyramimonas_sp.AAC.1
MAPRRPIESPNSPRRPQHGSKGTQDGPNGLWKDPQDGPKRRPGGLQRSPKFERHSWAPMKFSNGETRKKTCG